MQKWWRDTVLWLMIGSGILIILLSIFWLRSAYQDAKENLGRETSFIFANTIRNLEDSLIQNSFLSNISGDSIQGKVVVGVLNDTIGGSQNKVSVLRRRFRSIQAGDDGKRRRLHRRAMGISGRGSAGALSLYILLQDETATMELLDDSVDHLAGYALINQSVLESFKKEQYPFDFYLGFDDIQREEPDSLKAMYSASREHPFTTRPYHDMSSQKKYFVVLEKTRSFLLGKIRFQILFSLLLIGITFLAFFISFQALTKERRLTRVRKDLVSNITHELKTPIATVKVALEAIQNFGAGADPARSKEYLQIADTELDRLALLVDNVLKTSIQEGKEVLLDMERIDLQALIKTILSTMKLQFDKIGAEVTFVAKNQPMWVDGDKVHLTSVVYNLLDNALKYSNHQPKIDVHLSELNGHYELAISDRGLGIDRDQITRIFDKFYRVPQDDNRHDTKGYGLGLNYVSEVMKKHAGSIRVKSKKGFGSTFTIAMPQATTAL